MSLLGLCSAQPAVSQPGDLRPAAQRAEDTTKAWLEKTRRLENQVRSLQREVVQLRAEVDRLRDINLTAIELAEEDPPPPACDVPYAVDENGIKRYLPECLDAAALAAMKANCINPYIKRPDGVTAIRPECLR